MSNVVAALLATQSAESLKKLCEKRGMDRRGRKADLCAALALSYGTDAEALLTDLRRPDLIQYLSGRLEGESGRSFVFAYLHRASRQELIEVARARIAGWAPRGEDDKPIARGTIGVYLVDDDGISEDDDAEEHEQSQPDEGEDDDELEGWGEAGLPDYEVIDPYSVDPSLRPDVQLAKFQEQAIDAVRQHFDRGGERGLLCLPTGGGKTRTALDWLIRDFVGRGRKVLWVTHRLDLLDQVHEDVRGLVWLLRGVLPEVSVSRYDGARRNLSGDIILASAMSLARRMPTALQVSKKGKPLGIVCYDEAHRAVAPKIRDALLKVTRGDRRVPVVGLTATPFRTGQNEQGSLEAFFGARPVVQRTFKELVELGFLAKPVFLHQSMRSTQSFRIDPEEVRKAKMADGDFSANVLSELARHPKRNTEIVEHWCAQREVYQKTIVFACNIDHADELARMFNQRVTAEALHSGLDPEERRARLRRFKENKTQILVNVGILTEGANIPDTRTVLMARPTMSESLYLQMIGRGARGPRTVPGKTQFFVIDCVDNFGKHGLTLAGKRVAEQLGRDDAAPRPARSAAERPSRRSEAGLTSAASWLLLRGYDPKQYTFWGELRWTKPSGEERGIAVFLESLSQLEAAVELLKLGVEQRRFDSARQQASTLHQLGCVRADDWLEVVADCQKTLTPPTLHPIAEPPQADMDADLAAAQRLKELASLILGEPLHAGMSRCNEEWRLNTTLQRLFPSGLALYQEAAKLASELTPPVAASLPPRESFLDDVLALEMYIARADGLVHVSELQAIRIGTFQLLSLSDEAAFEQSCAAAERGTPDLEACCTRLRTNLSWEVRCALVDWLFRIALADGVFLEAERAALRWCARSLEVPEHLVEERLRWFASQDVSRPVIAVAGYKTCQACGSTWPDYARYCGECGCALGQRS